MRRNLLAAGLAIFTLSGGAYLSATPSGGTDLNCWNQATALHLLVEDFCGGEANCSFSCSSDFQHVTSMNCSCA